MLNMSIEMFTVKLDEMLETRAKLIEQQEIVNCFNGFDEKSSIMFYDKEQFLEFAKHKGLEVTKEKSKTTSRFQYRMAVLYKDIELECWLTEKEYKDLEGRLP